MKELLKKLWDRIQEEEIADHFPRELILALDQAVNGEIVCSECGSSSVQTVVWVDANNMEVQDDYGSWNETDTKWCNDCGKHVELIDTSVVEAKTA